MCGNANGPDCANETVSSRAGITHNVGVYDGLGLGALVKAARPTSATSCKLSTVTNVNNEIEWLLAHRTPS